VDGELKPEWKEKYHARSKELGIWKMEVPEEFDGVGADLISLCIVWEQLGRTIAVPTRGLGGIMGPQVRAPLYELNEEMKKLYLYPVLKFWRRRLKGFRTSNLKGIEWLVSRFNKLI
jgi:acyl-CoA dehydrogenase